MISRLNVYDFRDAFRRADRYNTFSYEGYEILFDYLEEIDEDWELDVIAICCDFSEYSREEALNNYNVDSVNDLRDNTTVLEVAGGDRLIIEEY